MTQARSRLPEAIVKALTAFEHAGEIAPPPKTGEVKLTLKELVKAAEVSERTIRYYIQEGVLPPPQGAGPGSRYGLEHLTRLSLVRRLKAALLPLSQIKQLLSELTSDQLEQIADQLYNDLAHTNPVIEGKTPTVRERGIGTRKPALGHSLYDEALEVFHPPDDSVVNQGPEKLATVLPELDSLNFAGRWNRLALAPGLELHYQEGGSQDNSPGRERLARLVELAMRMYG